MNGSTVRLGFLHDGDLDEEESAALAFARSAVDAVETVTLAAVSEGSADLNRFDACWWHAHAPVDDPATVAAAADRIGAFLADGGGLLLSARAFGQVSALGLDPVAPDATGTEAVTDPVGPLWKAVYADHPAVDGLDGLRHHMRPAGSDGPYARYESVLPERADVLASTYRGLDEVPTEVSVVQWRVGEGTALGVGVGLEFAQHDDAETEATRERFAANVLRWLGGDASTDSALATGRPKSGAELARYRDALAADPDRPSYHVTAPVNWLNDPNGLIHHNGRYHLFYQYNPGGPHHHTVHWGHAVSEALVPWEDRPVALTPDPGGPDRDGCWSGCAVAVRERPDGSVVPAGTPEESANGGHAEIPTDAPVDAAGDADAIHVLYTGGREGWQLPCLATATDADLTRFDQDEANPVIDTPPAELDLLSTPGEPAHFRDHALTYAAGRWHQLVGVGLQDRGGCVVRYTSDDLREWTYAGPVLVDDAVEPGVVWECPELLRYPDGDLLHVSDYSNVRYFRGSFDADAGRFSVEDDGILDPGAFYAPQSFETPDGRTLMVGWLTEDRSVARQWDAGWSGAMSLPREVWVEDGEVHQRPARELTALREEQLYSQTLRLDDHAERLPLTGDTLELHARIDPETADEVGLVVRASPDTAECTTIRVRREEVEVDRADASLDPEAHDRPVTVPVDDLDAPFDLRVFVDGSVLELFVNERRAVATRFYPTRHDATGVAAFATAGGATVGLDVWRLGSAWDARE